MPSAKDTELVAFGVCHDNPRLVTLANVDTSRAMSFKASHLGVLVIRPEVEMQPTLDLLALIKPDEVQPWHAIRLRADLELLIRGVDHNPTKSLRPPLPQGHRIHRVNNYLFPFQGHPPSLGLPGLGLPNYYYAELLLRLTALPRSHPVRRRPTQRGAPMASLRTPESARVQPGGLGQEVDHIRQISRSVDRGSCGRGQTDRRLAPGRRVKHGLRGCPDGGSCGPVGVRLGSAGKLPHNRLGSIERGPGAGPPEHDRWSVSARRVTVVELI
jgi:hypothetical protein